MTAKDGLAEALATGAALATTGGSVTTDGEQFVKVTIPLLLLPGS